LPHCSVVHWGGWVYQLYSGFLLRHLRVNGIDLILFMCLSMGFGILLCLGIIHLNGLTTLTIR
jgi:hypothetical protein